MSIVTERAQAAAWTSGEIFELVRQGRAHSRAELAAITGMSPSTAAGRVEQLVEAGLLVQARNHRGGRQPRALSVDPAFGHVIAVDIGSRHAQVAAVDAVGSEVASRERSSAPQGSPKAFLDWLAVQVEELMAESTLGGANHVAPRLLGIALSVPAPIDAVTGRMTYPARLLAWHDADLASPLEDRFGVPVLVDNDAMLMGLAELRLRQEADGDLVFLKLGRGISLGFVWGGSIWRGAGGGAGTIGHIPVGAFAAEDTRRLCPCGRDDCLEACFGAEALFERVRERGADLGDFADDVLAAAKAGHTQAVEVFREAGRVIGNAVAIACDVINPSVLVLGGSLSSVEPLTNALKAAVFERVSILSSRRLRVEPSVAGAKAGISGASALILDHVLSPGRIDSLLQNGANGREPTTVTPAG